jgi:hypothetical protein
MECTRQRYNLGYFHFTDHRCVEKLMTGFRIDGHTIKRGNLVPLERSNFAYVLGSSGVAS